MFSIGNRYIGVNKRIYEVKAIIADPDKILINRTNGSCFPVPYRSSGMINRNIFKMPTDVDHYLKKNKVGIYVQKRSFQIAYRKV